MVVRNPPVHHCRHYPTTEFSATNTPLGPLTLRRAPSRARYQPAAIPTATTESRDRPRVVGSPPVSHPTRRHATPRRAQRVFLCIAFQKPASVRSLIARPSYRKSSARRNLARLRTRATPKGSAWLIIVHLSATVIDNTVRDTTETETERERENRRRVKGGRGAKDGKVQGTGGR